MNTRVPIPLVGVAMVEWASWYALALEWKVFPCKGKKPYTKNGFKDATTDLEQIKAWWAKWPTANIGTPTGDDFYVIDQDNRADGNLTLRDLEDSYSDLPPTVTCLTGRKDGSQHKYFVGPVVNKADIGAGLDVQGDGAYVILPPSIHPETGLRYEWESDFDPESQEIAPAPDWLTALVTTPKPSVAIPADTDDGRDLLEIALESDEPILEHYRNDTLFALGEYYHRKGMPFKDVSALLHGINATRCQPPLALKEVNTTVKSACSYTDDTALQGTQRVDRNGIQAHANTALPGYSNSHIAQSANDLPRREPEYDVSAANWVKELFNFKNGERKQNAFNLGLILQHHPYWQQEDKQLWYDVIRGRHMCGVMQISKTLATQAAKWFGGQMKLGISNVELLKLCMETEAQEHQRDLLKEHLIDLPAWDGEPRLESWLSDYTEAPDDPYTREISRRLPVSMVARVLYPGCQYREVIILEGKENAGKSNLVEIFATPEWYVSLSMNMESKDAHIMLHQYWLAELAELDAVSRTEDSRMKAFITMRSDSYVPKYSNVSISIPRRTIFVGTTNNASAYLKGQTGNTRYLPLWLGTKVDRDAIEKHRDQILAEAIVHYHMRLEDWWAMTDDAEERAQEEREKRRDRVFYEDPLNDWLEVERFNEGYFEHIYDVQAGRMVEKRVEFLHGETSWPEIARWYLKLETPEKWKDRSLQMQIAASLKTLGWESALIYRHGHQARVWRKLS